MTETGALDDLAWLRRLARHLVRDVATADDAVQETLLAAAEARRPSRAWLAQVLHNAIRQEHRGRARRDEREALAAQARRRSHPAPDELLAELETHRLLADEVRALDEPYRETLLLRFVREWSPRRIASHQGVPVKTVHTRIERGLARLRERLDRRGPRERWLSAVAALADPRPTPALSLATIGTALMSVPVQLGLAAVALTLIGIPFLLRDGAPEASPESIEATARDAAGPGADLQIVGQREERRSGDPIAPPAATPANAGAPATETLSWIEGDVVDSDGVPVRDVVVAFHPKGPSGFEAASDSIRATSDATGRFRVRKPEGAGRFDVTQETWTALHRPYHDPWRKDSAYVLVVSPRRAYAGTVIDDAGRPVTDARVAFSAPDAHTFVRPLVIGDRRIALRMPFAETRTDERGEFEAPSVGFLANARIEASRDGYEPAVMALPDASTLDLRIVLARAAVDERSIAGRVTTRDGTPAGHALVSAGREYVRTDADGDFALALETWRKEATIRTFHRTEGVASVRLERDDVERALAGEPVRVLLPGPPLTLRGLVVDERGDPVPGARVWTPDTTFFGNAPTTGEHAMNAIATTEALGSGHPGPFPWTHGADADERGEFRLEGMSPRSYQVFVSDIATLRTSGPIAATPGPEPVEFVLANEPTVRVAGIVVDGKGAPRAGVRIHARRRLPWTPPANSAARWDGSPVRAPGAELRSLDHTVVSDAEGRFEFEALVHTGTTIQPHAYDAWFPAGIDLDDVPDVTSIRVVAREHVELTVTCRPDADELAIRTRDDEMQPLFLPLEDVTMSTARVAVVQGCSLSMITGAGPATIVLFRDDEEIERRDVELRGPVQRLEL